MDNTDFVGDILKNIYKDTFIFTVHHNIPTKILALYFAIRIFYMIKPNLEKDIDISKVLFLKSTKK